MYLIWWTVCCDLNNSYTSSRSYDRVYLFVWFYINLGRNDITRKGLRNRCFAVQSLFVSTRTPAHAFTPRVGVPALHARADMSSASSSTASGQVPIRTYLEQAEGFALALSKSAVLAFESRCAITRSECEGLHYSACQSRLSDAECATSGITSQECSEAGCGSVLDFSRPVGE